MSVPSSYAQKRHGGKDKNMYVQRIHTNGEKNGKNVFDLIKQMNETHHTLLTISCPYIYGTNINSMDVMRYAANDVPECFIELCVHDTHTIPFPVTGYSNTCAHTNAETSPKHFI